MRLTPSQIGSGVFHDHVALRSSEFAAVKAHGKSYVGRYIIMNCLAAPDGESRLGLIVSRRYHRHAVKRNRARRIIRESFRLLRHGIHEPVWLVVISRQYLKDCSLQDCQNEFQSLLTEAGVFESC